jgi:hypothetical protein
VGVPVLQTEVTQVWEATSAGETSAQEAAMTRDSNTTWVMEAEDRATMMEGKAQVKLLRVEKESTVAQAYSL